MTRARPQPALASGTRVFIRHVTPNDADELLAVRVANRAMLEPWEPIPVDGSNAWDRAWAERVAAQSDRFDTQRHAVCTLSDDDHGPAGRICGLVSLGHIVRGPLCNAYIGYWLIANASGKGYATEAVRLVLGRAFGPLGLHRVEANIMPSNTRSLALARRVGFREEGFSPKYLQIAGAWADHTRWAMTIEDWNASGDEVSPVRSPASI